MGILRTDRVSGLGGANAIKGSVFFDGSGTLTVEDSDDFHYDTGDFTIEGWIFATGRDNQMMLLGQWDGAGSVAGSLAWAVQLTNNSNGFLRFLTSSTGTNVVLNQNGTSGTVFDNKWHHFAVTRNGNDYKLFTDGVVVGSVTDSNAIANSPFALTIGGSNRLYSAGAASTQTFTGFLSNIRIIKGEALYTAAFTPPTSELTVTPNTVLLACQSPSDVIEEKLGKRLTPEKSSVNSTGPIPSRFTPNSPVGFSTTTDVGTQFGSTFDGVTTFDSQAYMVPPGGNTRERNRGRGLIFGGYSPNPAGHVSTIQSIEIQSFGNAQDFGDLSSVRSQMGAVSSSTRAVSCGGGNDTPSDYTDTNTCEFVTIASTSNTTDFGDLTVSRQPYKGCSNDTRGIIFGGYIHPTNSNTIDFITIATTGNATDFGDEIDTNRAGASCSSTTRGIVAGGFPATNRISFVEIATTGNAQDFGDLLNSVVAPSGCSDKTRGVFAGGATPTAINVIQFITMSSAGDATDFGDLNTTEKVGSKGNSNSIRGIFSGGYDGGTFVNSISAITIATTGNAVDFGDISGTLRYAAGTSDSHGGLS